MSETPDEVLAETVAKRLGRSCEVRHARIEKLETLAAKTAQAVNGHELRINDMEERITGLHQAHSATLIAVEACTHSNNRLSTAIDRLETWLVGWIADYDQHKSAFAEHKESNAADKFALPRVAVWLWLSTMTAFGAVLAFLVAERHAIVAWLSKVPWK